MSKYSSRLCVVGLLLLCACSGKSSVLAKVQGKDVTQQELDGYLRTKHIPAADVKRREAAFDELLQRDALAAIIEKEPGLDKAAIDAELADVRRELMISRYMDGFLEQKVTDAAVKAYYDAHVKDYEQRKVHVAHILVRTNSRMSDAEKAAKLTTASELKAKLDAGASFEELARSSSDDKISGTQGGDLGWMREGSVAPEFSQRAFSSPPGAISEPFATAFGYHVLKVLEAPTVVRRPYQAVLGEIRYQLRAEAKEAELKRLKGLIKIEKKGAYKLDPKAAPVASARPAAVPSAGAFVEPSALSLPPPMGAPSQPNGTTPNHGLPGSLQPAGATGSVGAGAGAPQPKAPSSTKTELGAQAKPTAPARPAAKPVTTPAVAPTPPAEPQ